MNNFERIKVLSLDEMAKQNVRGFTKLDEDGFNYDVKYVTSDGKFFEDIKKAIKHEKMWLLQEVKK